MLWSELRDLVNAMSAEDLATEVVLANQGDDFDIFPSALEFKRAKRPGIFGEIYNEQTQEEETKKIVAAGRPYLKTGTSYGF